jgi:hypothetical protein
MDGARDGSTPANAILEDQNVWRRRNCPGFTVAMQKLMVKDGKHFDELTLRKRLWRIHRRQQDIAHESPCDLRQQHGLGALQR